MWVKVKFVRESWVFVYAYGPGSEREETEREAFWNYLDDCLQSFGVNVCIVLLEDVNAHVGDEVVEDVVGKHRMPRRYENGERMIELGVEGVGVWKYLVLEKDIHKYTLMKQDNGKVVDRAMMDYVAVSRKIIGYNKG